MEQRLWMILQLFGGAALFLYSMDTLTDALQQAAGDTLRQALARLTAHPLAGVLTGAAVTAVVQSSSAVTVLVLGLVGAGLLTLQRAVPVVFGANIGTTVTAQLLAFRLEDARYLLLVAGLLLWFAGRGRLHAAGQALFAFGLLADVMLVLAFYHIARLLYGRPQPMLLALFGALAAVMSFSDLGGYGLARLMGVTSVAWPAKMLLRSGLSAAACIYVLAQLFVLCSKNADHAE